MHPNNPKPPPLFFLRVVSAFVLLFFPLLVAAILYFVRPGWLMQLFYRYTGIPEYTYSAPLDSVFLPRLAIETLSRVWNILVAASLLTAFLVCVIVLIQFMKHASRRSSPHKRKTIEYLSFWFIAVIGGSLAWFNIPGLLSWGIVISTGYALNFSAADKLLSARFIPLFITGAMTGVSQFFLPVHTMKRLSSFLFPKSLISEKVAVLCGRTSYCLVTLSISTIVFLSFRPQTISPHAKVLLPGKDFYDVEIDSVGRTLFLTNKYAENQLPCYAFQLDDLSQPPKPFVIPSFEIEDLAVDAIHRKLYHIERFEKTLICLDADSLRVLWRKKLPAYGEGSVTLDLDINAQILIILWENDFLFTLDLESWTSRARHIGRGAGMVYDPDRRLIYCHSGPPNRIEAIELHTLTSIAVAPAPDPDRMALSRKFNSLYVSDAMHARVWVFSVPSLKPLPGIKSQFGVRPLAVDDENQILLTGGTVTGNIEVHRLPDGGMQQRHYIGRLSRRIAIDHQNRHSFITGTENGLFLLEY